MNRKRQRERAVAIAMLLAIEMAMACVPGGILAAVLVPVAYHIRWHFAMGGEWMLIYMTVMVAYHLIHKRIFRKSRKWQKGGTNAGGQTARRAVRRRGNTAVRVGRCA